jgi:hypothetical protein
MAVSLASEWGRRNGNPFESKAVVLDIGICCGAANAI